MQQTEPRIAVVVVTWHSARVLPGLLDSLPSALSGVSWDLVVADNDSADETLAVLADAAPDSVVVRMGGNAGYAAGVNAGIAAAGSRDAYLVLNPDVRLSPGSVGLLMEALRRPGIGIAVPLLVDATGQRIDSLRREPGAGRALAGALLGERRAGAWGSLGEVITDPTVYERPTTVDWAEGSTQLLSAACARAVGEWDETFFLYSEETDLHLRARDRGFALAYVPEAKAQHLEGGSSSSPTLWPLLVANRLRLHRKRHGIASSMLYWMALFVRESSRALLGREPSRHAVRVLMSPRMLRAPRGPEWLTRLSGSAQSLDQTDH